MMFGMLSVFSEFERSMIRESKYVNNAVLIDNMVGASKILGMYSEFISGEQKDFLRYQKLYKGETTLINLTENHQICSKHNF